MDRESKCEICGSNVFEIIGNKRFQDIQTKKISFDFEVRLVCCKKCGIIFQDPIQDPKRMEEYYVSMYREEGYRPRLDMEKQFSLRVDLACKFLEKTQRVLEVGCADGTTLNLFQQKGMITYGIEPSESNAALCVSRGIEVFCGIYENFLSEHRKGECFDLVCSYFVLEHAISPVDFLSFCNCLVNLNGIVCIEVPDIGMYNKEESLSDLLFFYEHQFHFTRETISILLSRCGFELVEFAPSSSLPFGMHLCARKTGKPVLQGDLEIPRDVFHIVMKKVRNYQDAFTEREVFIRGKLNSLIKKRILDKQNIVIFGAGVNTKALLSFPNFKEVAVKYIVDNCKDKQGSMLCDFPIYSPDKIDDSVDGIIIASKSFENEIFNQLVKAGVEPSKIMKMYS